MAIVTINQRNPTLKTRMTFAEYVEQEQTSDVKHHYFYGRFIEVAGASLEHNTINGNFIIALGVALRGTNCRVMPSDMKVYVSPNVVYYPDMVVACGQPLITLGEALQNPILVAEVLSPSTAAFDRGEKFREYRTIPSLHHIIFLEQDSPIIEHYSRGEDNIWKVGDGYNSLNQSLELAIEGRNVTLPLSEIYQFVDFEDPSSVV